MPDPTRRTFAKAGALIGIAPLAGGAQGGDGIVASSYLGRYLAYNRPTDHDQHRMPQRRLVASSRAAPLTRAGRVRDLSSLPITPHANEAPRPLAHLLASTGTTALVVLQGGQIVWEHYPNGGAREQAHRCFSVTKSIASALLGMAVAQGAVDSVEATIGRWLPDVLDPAVRALTIAHLLEMRSGIRFTEGMLPWNDEPQTYYANDLRRRLLERTVCDPVGAFFHYNDWHPLLLTLLLERATGQTVTAWLQDRLWQPLGAEHAASMMVDRADGAGLEHLESGLTASALDLAKFGQLYLQDGVWQGQRLLPAGWVEATTSPAGARSDAAWFAYYRDRPWGRVFAGGRTYYRRMWWGHFLPSGGHDFFAMGVLGQHVYVSPDTGSVVVRLSSRFPPGMWWAPVLRAVAVAAAERA